MSMSFDLLGDSILENFGCRGRPPHLPTEENRNKVRLLLAFGWTTPRIAQALRITGAPHCASIIFASCVSAKKCASLIASI